MKIRIVIAIAAIVCTLCLCACAKTVTYDLAGEWKCMDSFPDCESGYGYYHLTIDEDGTFSLYDEEAGNPGIKGKLTVNGNGSEGTLKLRCEGDDFNPPVCWEINKKDSLDYAILTGGIVKLGRNGKWLAFSDENYIENEFSSFRLADRSRSKGYEWSMELKGDGDVYFSMSEEKDSDVGIWQCYSLESSKPGDVLLTMKYEDGKDVMYTVTFDLTVLADGTVIENSRDGDIDEAMTT